MSRLRGHIAKCFRSSGRALRRVSAGHSHRRAQAGFTLIEVLVSLALLALILALVPSGLQLGRRAWDSSLRLQRQSEQTIVAAFLESRIAQAMPLSRRDAAGQAALTFKGEPDAVAFVAPSRDGPMGPGLFTFELRVRDEGGRRTLWMSWTPYQPSSRGGTPAVEGERALLRDVSKFELRYFGRRGAGERDWGLSWTGAEALPELVEITLTSAAGSVGPQVPITIEMPLRDMP